MKRARQPCPCTWNPPICSIVHARLALRRHCTPIAGSECVCVAGPLAPPPTRVGPCRPLVSIIELIHNFKGLQSQSCFGILHRDCRARHSQRTGEKHGCINENRRADETPARRAAKLGLLRQRANSDSARSARIADLESTLRYRTSAPIRSRRRTCGMDPYDMTRVNPCWP